MNESESFQQAIATAQRFLSYRPRSEAEIRARLRRRFPAHVIERVMEALAERDLVDDTAFAKLWSASRDALNPRSASAIKRELLSKGVARDTAEAAVRDVADRDSAYRAGLKWARQLEQTDFPTFRRKLWGYLQRRGFASSVIHNTVAQLWRERHVDHGRQPGSPSGRLQSPLS